MEKGSVNRNAPFCVIIIHVKSGTDSVLSSYQTVVTKSTDNVIAIAGLIARKGKKTNQQFGNFFHFLSSFNFFSLSYIFLALIPSRLTFQVSILPICQFKGSQVSMYCCCSEAVGVFLVIQKPTIAHQVQNPNLTDNSASATHQH